MKMYYMILLFVPLVASQPPRALNYNTKNERQWSYGVKDLTWDELTADYQECVEPLRETEYCWTFSRPVQPAWQAIYWDKKSGEERYRGVLEVIVAVRTNAVDIGWHLDPNKKLTEPEKKVLEFAVRNSHRLNPDAVKMFKKILGKQQALEEEWDIVEDTSYIEFLKRKEDENKVNEEDCDEEEDENDWCLLENENN